MKRDSEIKCRARSQHHSNRTVKNYDISDRRVLHDDAVINHHNKQLILFCKKTLVHRSATTCGPSRIGCTERQVLKLPFVRSYIFTFHVGEPSIHGQHCLLNTRNPLSCNCAMIILDGNVKLRRKTLIYRVFGFKNEPIWSCFIKYRLITVIIIGVVEGLQSIQSRVRLKIIIMCHDST